MAKTIMVNIVPEEIKMALLEENELLEVSIERAQGDNATGNIYKGKIKNVLPGMQAAFIDIGCGKNAFLHLRDIIPPGQAESAAPALTAGQDILVQIVKDASGTKGPRATTHLTLPGRYVVMMPTVEYIGVSRRIAENEERERLKRLAAAIKPPGMGMIVRTVAEGKSGEDLQKDIAYLTNLWNALTARAKRAGAPTLLYRDADLVIRLVRDYFTADIDAFIVDNNEAYQRVCDLLKFISPELQDRVQLYQGDEDIFRYAGLDAEMGKLGQRKIWLKSGGYIVIDRTEALTAIDVNTGKFIGHTNLADTVFQTNLEAAAEIARQVRLRDIGGIIIIDFIDMDAAQHQQAVLGVLEEKTRQDKTKTNILGLTALGLVEMTRKKTRQNVEGVLYSECPCCEGRGRVKSPETVLIDAFRELRKIATQKRLQGAFLLQVHPRVAALSGRGNELRRLEQEIGRRLTVEAVESMHPEVYSILQIND